MDNYVDTWIYVPKDKYHRLEIENDTLSRAVLSLKDTDENRQNQLSSVYYELDSARKTLAECQKWARLWKRAAKKKRRRYALSTIDTGTEETSLRATTSVF
jgi:hypothetical protein